MLTIRDHGVEDYAGLAYMDASDVGVLGEDDRACLEDLGGYLVESGAWKRFGIWLLHKHFEPAPGEVFVERAMAARRKTETTPMVRSAFSEQGLSTTSIRFGDTVGPGLSAIGMEFAEPADLGDTAPLGDHDEAVLAGIAERLTAHGKTERFGVRLIRNPLSLSEHELLHETCESARRTLHCNVGERDALLTDKTVVQTAWRWKVVDGETARTVMQDCTATCTGALVNGHDIGHFHSEPDYFGND